MPYFQRNPGLTDDSCTLDGSKRPTFRYRWLRTGGAFEEWFARTSTTSVRASHDDDDDGEEEDKDEDEDEDEDEDGMVTCCMGAGDFISSVNPPKKLIPVWLSNCCMRVGDSISTVNSERNPNSGTVWYGPLAKRQCNTYFVNKSSSVLFEVVRNSLVFTLFCSWANHGVCA
jgi:hypothetical protein